MGETAETAQSGILLLLQAEGKMIVLAHEGGAAQMKMAPSVLLEIVAGESSSPPTTHCPVDLD